MSEASYKENLPPFVSTSDTSREAAESIKESAGSIRAKVFNFIYLRGKHGATCDEVEEALNLRHQTASARCKELMNQGKLIRVKDEITGSLIRRPTRSGRGAYVLFPTDTLDNCLQ